MTSPLLTVELVPETSWYTNVRSQVPADIWDKIRRDVYKAADYQCEICGGKGDKWPVECHEVWEYDDAHHIQTLIKMIALCPSCHMVKHIGFAQIRGRGKEAIEHLMTVNKWTHGEAEQYIEQAFDQWKARGDFDWTVITSLIDSYQQLTNGGCDAKEIDRPKMY